MSSANGGYYLPEPSHWPIVGSIGMFTLLGGFGIYLNGGTSIGLGSYTVTLTNSTLSENFADIGGGIWNSFDTTTSFINSIIANSTAGGDCINAGAINDQHGFSFANPGTDRFHHLATTRTILELRLSSADDRVGLCDSIT